MSRGNRAKQGQETVGIVDRGWYESAGERVDIRTQVDRCVKSTALHRPTDLQRQVEQLPPAPRQTPTVLRVSNETTLSAARRMVCEEGKSKTLALNFASAKNPGGGFLGGSQAQEESLARSSALYASLLSQPGYYDANRLFRSALYTDHMILSPAVPVFRDDDGEFLRQPYLLSILTAPAPNAGAITVNSPHLNEQVMPTIKTRLHKLLALAAVNGYEHLLLGAWGCGVFRNDPSAVAGLFAQALLNDEQFRNRFVSVEFAVLDTQPGEQIIGPFREAFGGGT
ncbi:TIGR02452 family protein [Anatilimnocola floriformis]|uniref:TIGR02452 family protein n=1 Tax=Anatilimnocola floriformis TaxID=2948575 RepID=UPI0020C1D051|nr:TIGR02452 family protein [Anatilimnocola floriformis]